MSEVQKKPKHQSISELSYQDTLIDILRGKIEVGKKINKPVDDHCLRVIFGYINRINNLSDEAMMLDDRNFDNILIPEIFSAFILPSKVSINPVDRRATNLLDYNKDAIISNIDYHKFLEQCDVLWNYYKQSPPEGKKLSEIRVEKSLFDVLSIASFEGKVNWDGKTPFIPIPLKGSFFNESYFNTSCNDLYKEWALNFNRRMKG